MATTQHYWATIMICILSMLRLNMATLTKKKLCRAAAFDSPDRSCAVGYRAVDVPIHSRSVKSYFDCTNLCLDNPDCHGVNLLRSNVSGGIMGTPQQKTYDCELLNVTNDNCNDLEYEEGASFYRKIWTNQECEISEGETIHIPPFCEDEESYCSVGWQKTLESSNTGDITSGSLENLIQILKTGAEVYILSASSTQITSHPPIHWAFETSSDDVIFYFQPENQGFDRFQSALSINLGMGSTINASNSASSEKRYALTVFTRLHCGASETGSVHDDASIGSKEKLRAWLQTQERGGRYVVLWDTDKLYSSYTTSSTLYDPRLSEFAAAVKLDSVFYNAKSRSYYRMNPIRWANILFLSTGRTDAKTKTIGGNFVADRDEDASTSWFPDTCRKKVYSINRRGRVDPSFDFDNLRKELLGGQAAPVYVKVEGQMGILTFEADLIVCQLNESTCYAVSDGNLQISGGILKQRSKLELSSGTDLDSVYVANGSSLDYYEVQESSFTLDTAPDQKVTWYKSTRPYRLVYQYNVTTQEITGNLPEAISAGGDLLVVLTDHSADQAIVWRVVRANVIGTVGFFQVHTRQVLRPKVVAPSCTDAEGDKGRMNRWKLVLQAMKQSKPVILLYTMTSSRKAACSMGLSGMRYYQDASVAVFASQTDA